MSAYLIADIKVTNDGWVPEYAASVHELVHKHGGRYLSRSGHVKTIEGKPLETSLIAIIEFPSTGAAEAFVRRSRLRALRGSAPGRERQPVPADRRHRPRWHDPIPAARPEDWSRGGFSSARGAAVTHWHLGRNSDDGAE